MKSFSNRIFTVFLFTLILLFGGNYLYSQTGDMEESPQADSRSGLLEAGSIYEGLFRLTDTDQDNFVTQDEWQKLFANHDKDGDNRLSKKEMKSISVQGSSEGMPDPDQGRLAAFERLDINESNLIDSSEWPGKDKDFSYLDANHNGSLSREEFLSKSGRFWNQPFESMDFNSDGMIARSEWLDSDESFDRLDRDSNGAVEKREFYNPR